MNPAQQPAPVRLAGPPELTAECALPALAELVAGGLLLEVTLGRPAERLLDMLAAGSCDVVLSTIRPVNDKLRVIPLPDEQFVLVASPGWQGRIDPARPAGTPIISVGTAMPVIRRYWKVHYDAEPPGAPAVVVPDLRAVLRLVCGGAGMTVLPRYLCKNELASGRLVDLVRPDVVPTNELFLALRSGEVPDAVREVSDRLVAGAATW